MQTPIPFVMMRGGSSRGPYFNRDDLPEDLDTLAQVLIHVVGAGHPLNIDGIGGSAAVTTKVAMLSRSDDEWADIDYFFGQVAVEKREVDFKPTCGNILSGVASAAVELGLFKPTGDVSEVKIRAVNTGARIAADILTPNGVPEYAGDVAIDGVPGTAAPVRLRFMDVMGGATGEMLPTGNRIDDIDGVEVTCLDVAMPMVIARAADFGITGYETRDELDANTELFQRIEAVRLKAGERMGMGDVTQSVTPKFGLLAPAREGGHVTARYFMPWKTHPTMAVTGAQCLSACILMPGSIAEGIANRPSGSPTDVIIEHPSGQIEVLTEYQSDEQGGFAIQSAGLTRTTRKLVQGEVFIPGSVWAGR